MCNARNNIDISFAYAIIYVRGETMKNVNITLRVDEDLKKQADALFSELGMTLTTAFNIFLRQSVREQQIPFKVSKNIPNAITLAAMEAAEKGEDIYGPYDNVSDLMEALNAEG